jgi:hypothetical protein
LDVNSVVIAVRKFVDQSVCAVFSSTNVFLDFNPTFLTPHVAAPVELTVASFNDRPSDRVETPSAAHELAAVGRVGGDGPVARSAPRSQRPGTLIGLAEVRRGTEVD